MADTEKKDSGAKVENLTGVRVGDDSARNFGVEGNELDGYIGVSPEYMTYADDTQKPYSTDEEVLPPGEQLEFEEEGDGEGEKEEDSKVSTSPASTSKSTPSSSQPAAKAATPSATAKTSSK